MPELTLTDFTSVSINRQVSINNDQTLNTDGERHVFLGRLVDSVSRTDTEREQFIGATETFVKLMKEEYGDRIGTWATRNLTQHITDGKPLTGYRIAKIVAEAEEQLALIRQGLDHDLERGLPGMVERELQALSQQGVPIDDNLREHFLEVTRQSVQKHEQFRDPTKLEHRTFQAAFGETIRQTLREEVALVNEAMKIGRDTRESWRKDGRPFLPDFNTQEVATQYTQLFREELEIELLKKGITEQSSPEERQQAISESMDKVCGHAFKRLIKSEGESGGGMERYGEGLLDQKGETVIENLTLDPFMESQIDQMRNSVNQSTVSDGTKGKFNDLIGEMEGIRQQVLLLEKDDPKNHLKMLELCGRIGTLREQATALMGGPDGPQLKNTITLALESQPKEQRTLQDQLTRLENAVFHRVGASELTGKNADTLRPDLETMGQWMVDLQDLGKREALLGNPGGLFSTLSKFDDIERHITDYLAKDHQGAFVNALLQDMVDNVRHSREQIRETQQQNVDFMTELRGAGFTAKQFSRVSEVGGTFGELRTLFQDGFTPPQATTCREALTMEQIQQFRALGFSPEQITELVEGDGSLTEAGDLRARGAEVDDVMGYFREGFSHDEARMLLRHEIPPGEGRARLQDARQRSRSVNFHELALRQGYDHMDILWFVQQGGKQEDLVNFSPLEIHLLQQAGLSLKAGQDYKTKNIPITEKTIPREYRTPVVSEEKPLIGGTISKPIGMRFLDREGADLEAVYKEEKPEAPIGGAGLSMGLEQGVAQMGMRNIATEQMDKMLGFGLIPHTEFGVYKDKVGIVMGFVPGAPALYEKEELVTGEEAKEVLEALEVYKGIDDEQQRTFLEKKVGRVDKEGNVYAYRGGRAVLLDFNDPDLCRDLTKLQLLDALCGQGDRHGGNYKVQLDENGNYLGLLGIDNDQAFAEVDDPNLISKEKNKECNGVALPPVVDTDMVQALEEIDEIKLRQSLSGLITEKEIDSVINRLHVMLDHVHGDDCLVIQPNEWGQVRGMLRDPNNSYVGRDSLLREKMETETYEDVAN